MTYALVLHGGAGARPGTDYSAQQEHMGRLIAEGQAMLEGGKPALDVITHVIAELEASGLYVAGKGSAPNTIGRFELDASIMNGADQSGGAVAAIEGFMHPIKAARAVMDDGRHVMLTSDGAHSFAIASGLDTINDPNTYYTEHESHGSGDAASHGTVGAVALDVAGNLAAGTSTGGTFNKMPGRVGDTPLIGAGTWADGTVAVSGTGVGEAFIRTAAAHDVSARMRYGGQDITSACTDVLAEVRKYGGDGGLIAIDASGNIAMPYNSHGMKRAAVSSTMPAIVRVFEPED